MLYQKLPDDVSDKLACCIENTVSRSLKNELAVLGNSILKYEETQECMKQDLISAIVGSMGVINRSRSQNQLLAFCRVLPTCRILPAAAYH
jgi:hypothetical protein